MINIDFKFPDWRGKLERHAAELNLFIAAQIQFNRGMMFDKEGAWNGHPKWEGLKFRRGQILSKRGTLRKSIAPYNPKGQAGPDGIVRFAGDVITVGTKLLYARMMNDGTKNLPGGVLRPVRAKALKIPIPSGKFATDAAKGLRKSEGAFIFRKSVKIPPRPFDQWNNQDQEELNNALRAKLMQILNLR